MAELIMRVLRAGMLILEALKEELDCEEIELIKNKKRENRNNKIRRGQQKLYFIQSLTLNSILKNISLLENPINNGVRSIRKSISLVADSENIWELARDLNERVSILNQLSSELNSKQNLFNLHSRDFKQIANELEKIRNQVSYTGWA